MQSIVAIVEDEPDLREAVAEYLADAGYRVLAASNGTELRALVADGMPDVVILDVAMPGEDGFVLARWLRSHGSRPGIVFATAAGTAAHRIGGFEIGADDYLVKPYDLRELQARLGKLLARLPARNVEALAASPRSGKQILPFGPLALHLERGMATTSGGSALNLTVREFDVLAALAGRPDRVLSREALARSAGGEDEGRGRSIDILIARLRRKLETVPGAAGLIRTVRGEGYMLVAGAAENGLHKDGRPT